MWTNFHSVPHECLYLGGCLSARSCSCASNLLHHPPQFPFLDPNLKDLEPKLYPYISSPLTPEPGVLNMYMCILNMIFFKLHHSGTQFFQGNVDTILDPEIRRIFFRGFKRFRAQKRIFFALSSANPVFADVKIFLSTKIRYGVRTSN